MTGTSVAPLLLGARPLRPADVVAVAEGRSVALADEARERMNATRAALERMIGAATRSTARRPASVR